MALEESKINLTAALIKLEESKKVMKANIIKSDKLIQAIKEKIQEIEFKE